MNIIQGVQRSAESLQSKTLPQHWTGKRYYFCSILHWFRHRESTSLLLLLLLLVFVNFSVNPWMSPWTIKQPRALKEIWIEKQEKTHVFYVNLNTFHCLNLPRVPLQSARARFSEDKCMKRTSIVRGRKTGTWSRAKDLHEYSCYYLEFLPLVLASTWKKKVINFRSDDFATKSNNRVYGKFNSNKTRMRLIFE